MTQADVIVIGAGAAGLMCASTAAQRGRRVLLLEGAEKVGKKILISGGGRCNFTNIQAGPDNYISANPHFCKSAFQRYTAWDFIDLIERHEIAYHEKTLGQLFCDDRSRLVVDLLLDECRQGGVEIRTGCQIQSVTKQDQFELSDATASYSASSLMIASGGLSIPKMGASSFGHDIARQFGLGIVPCRPGLVPLTFTAADLERYDGLSGVSTPVRLRCGKQSFREAMLFTHKGLSGPAILQISSYWQPGESITIDLLPDLELVSEVATWRRPRPAAELKTMLATHLPARLVQRLLELHLPSKPIRQLNERDIQLLTRLFHEWEVKPGGTEGYRKAEVTIGGVESAELSSKTFESSKVPGLYFIGEVVDVTGWLGGYNFQWAWSSGHCAGLFV
ncbi:MAG TPA: aminoacetone oxidase family FAD-binding enzyme [Lentisphaeria bacterium]|nr:aminoacetone oxidase family FAD-binding enzyme [Lentisphaeria bacterium]